MSRHTDLTYEVTRALESSDGTWDIPAIVDELQSRGTDTDDPDFWTIVTAHEVPEEPAVSVETMTTALSATIAKTRVDRDALWRWDSITVRTRGISRVNQQLPQPLAEATVSAPGHDDVRLTGERLTWPRLWDEVAALHDEVAGAQSGALETARKLHREQAMLDARAGRARAGRDGAIRDAYRAGVPVAEIADALDMSEPGIRKVL